LEENHFPFLEQLGVKVAMNMFPPLLPRSLHAFMPSLEINGMGGGHQGHGIKTIIPCEAMAKMTARVVYGQQPRLLAHKIKNFFEQKIPHYASLTIHEDYHGTPYAVDFSNASPNFNKLFSTMELSLEKTFCHKPLHLREGGSIAAISLIKEILQIDSIMVGIVPTDANIHSPNENISIKTLQLARKAFREFFLHCGDVSA
jgi:acetylornithine deacetylase/succinyl-diaminopimelate desuccinylase-like protein